MTTGRHFHLPLEETRVEQQVMRQVTTVGGAGVNIAMHARTSRGPDVEPPPAVHPRVYHH